MDKKLILYGLLIVSFMNSCQKKPAVEANLDVLLSEKYETTSPQKISGSLRELYSPLIETFGDSIFLLTGKISRVDIQPKIEEVRVDMADDIMSSIQKQITQQTPKMISEQMDRRLDEISIEKIASIGTEKNNRESAVTNFLETNKYQCILVYSQVSNANDTLWNNYRVFNNIQTLRDSLNRFVCSQPSAKSLVIYNPPMKNHDGKVKAKPPGSSPPPPKPFDGIVIYANFKKIPGENKVEWSKSLADNAEKLTIRFTVNGKGYEEIVTNNTSFLYKPGNKQAQAYLTTVELMPEFGSKKVKVMDKLVLPDEKFNCE